ncbi:MAG TPA: hypothetical protein VGR97_08140 [Candidatus Acidoferrales bacterium]|nr:hypothetical protein [Candidatus Acidoferrales bacterium]
MTVEKIGPGQWRSTRVGSVFDSELAARHYDDLEALKETLAQDRLADEAAEKLSPDELLAIMRQAAHESDQKIGQKIGEDRIKDFIARHPEFVADGNVGVQNGAMMRGWLLAQGKSMPFEDDDIEHAYLYLAELGHIALTEPRKNGSRAVFTADFNETDAYEMPLEELKRRCGGL